MDVLIDMELTGTEVFDDEMKYSCEILEAYMGKICLNSDTDFRYTVGAHEESEESPNVL